MAHRYIGRNIYELRKKRGWSQSDLARKLDKKASTISSYETDSKTPSQFVKEYSPKSLRNREGFWYNRRKPPREAPSWKSTPKTPAAKQWLLT